MLSHKRYEGTLSHPELGDAIEISVDTEEGTWSAAGKSNDLEIEEKDGKIKFSDGQTEMVGEPSGSGVIEGEVIQDGTGGGTFTLKPIGKGVSGGGVNAVRKLRGKKGAPEPCGKKGARGDEYRALSVWFIVNKLMDDLGANDESKVYNVEPRIREKGADAECPRDGKKGTAYVDVADDPYAGYASHMLSYTWGYQLKEIKDTLQRFCSENSLDMKEVRVWMCFACINQHRVKEAQAKGETVPFEEFQKIFGERVQKIGHILPMMSPWNAPFYITRVWCCFEIFTAINAGDKVQVTILLPPKQSENFSEAFDKGGEEMVFQALRTINVEKSQASMPADLEQILKLIKDGPGFKKVNTEVVKHLRGWFMKQAFKNEVSRLCKLGKVYTSFGAYEPGLDMLSKAKDMLEQLGEATSPLAVQVAVTEAESQFFHKYYNGETAVAGETYEAYTKAELTLKKNGASNSFVAAEIITKKGLVSREVIAMGDGLDDEEKAEILKAALEDMVRGRKLFELQGRLKSIEGMWHLFVHAILLAEKSGTEQTDESFKASLDVYNEAIAIGKECGFTTSQEYVKGMHALGMLYFILKRWDDGIDYMREAKDGYEALGLTDSTFYIMAAYQHGVCLTQSDKRKDVKQGKCSIQDALDAATSAENSEMIGACHRMQILLDDDSDGGGDDDDDDAET
uniref:Uncharacterized protein n=1 Tax=Strombidinopsis acuminata TaxID=141414 RepID=A0A7S3WWS5_9SPIT